MAVYIWHCVTDWMTIIIIAKLVPLMNNYYAVPESPSISVTSTYTMAGNLSRMNITFSEAVRSYIPL